MHAVERIRVASLHHGMDQTREKATCYDKVVRYILVFSLTDANSNTFRIKQLPRLLWYIYILSYR